jgi:hypothetical protein
VRPLIAGLLCGAATLAARADEGKDACRKAPTRDCVLAAAEATADKIAAPFLRANALASVAAAERRAGLDRASQTLARAESAAKEIPADFGDGAKPPAFATVRAEMGDWAGALAYATGIDSPGVRTSALAQLALAEERHGRAEDAKAHFALALDAAGAIEPAHRPALIAYVARAEGKAGLPDAAAAYDLALAGDKAKGPQKLAIVYQMIRGGAFDRAYVEIMDSPQVSRDFPLRQLVGALARAGRVDQGATAAAGIGEHALSVGAWTDLAAADFRAGRGFDGAEKIVKAAAIGDEEATDFGKMEAKATIAGAEAAGGMTERAKGHIAEARAALAAETNPTFKQGLAEALALALARAGDTDAGIDALLAVEPRVRASYLVSIADDLEAAKRPGEAFAALEAIPADDFRFNLLLDLADRLPN